MCGLVGLLHRKDQIPSPLVIRAMTSMICHRGPDGEGFYEDEVVSMGHRRLAIIDTSDRGAQPMGDASGRYRLCFNGIVYNFKEMRRELEDVGYRFVSTSDTEVVLYALIEWGDSAIPRFNGMFSIVFWDSVERRLLLARDRYGIKPLYVWHSENEIAFASEIKAFFKIPGFSVSVNIFALDEYFTFQNLLGENTLFTGVKMFPPAHYQWFSYNISKKDWNWSTAERFWDFPFAFPMSKADPTEITNELYRLIVQSVNRQLVSDVPLGSYLSGGIDSGTIVSIASRYIPRLTTFTGGFDLSSAQGLEAGYDERAAAEIISNQFKTEHYEMVMHAGDMACAFPDLILHLEDLRLGQCYPNMYVARLASKFVKVVLSGAGGDELFAGYPWRYFGSANCAANGTYLKNYYQFWQRLVPDEEKKSLFIPDISTDLEPDHSFRSFCREFDNFGSAKTDIETNINRSLYFEAKSFLHGLFVVEDKLSMMYGLESRVPFLDNDLVDFACRIPPNMKLNNLKSIPRIDENELGRNYKYQFKSNDGKQALRNVVKKMIPEEISRRAKQGFSSPDVSWYRGESIDYVNDLLADPKARIYEYLSFDYVQEKLHAHMSGAHNYRLLIWSFLSFEWWLRLFLHGEISCCNELN